MLDVVGWHAFNSASGSYNVRRYELLAVAASSCSCSVQATPPLDATTRAASGNGMTSESSVLAAAQETASSKALDKRALDKYTLVLPDCTQRVFAVPKKCKAQQLLDRVFSTLAHTSDKCYFGLQYGLLEHGVLVHRWLDMRKCLRSQLSRAPFTSTHLRTLILRVKFCALLTYQQGCQWWRRQLATQVRVDLQRGWLVAPSTATNVLASYAAQIDCGDYTGVGDSHDSDYLSRVRFLPTNMTDEMRAKIVELHATHQGMSQEDAVTAYLEHARRLQMFGVDQHPAMDCHGVEIVVGVCSDGVVVARQHCIIDTFCWSIIVKIVYKHKQLLLQFRRSESEPPTVKVLAFRLSSCRACKNAWRSIVEHHRFFRVTANNSQHSGRPDPDQSSSSLLLRRSCSLRRIRSGGASVVRWPRRMWRSFRATATPRRVDSERCVAVTGVGGGGGVSGDVTSLIAGSSCHQQQRRVIDATDLRPRPAWGDSSKIRGDNACVVERLSATILLSHNKQQQQQQQPVVHNGSSHSLTESGHSYAGGHSTGGDEGGAGFSPWLCAPYIDDSEDSEINATSVSRTPADNTAVHASLVLACGGTCDPLSPADSSLCPSSSSSPSPHCAGGSDGGATSSCQCRQRHLVSILLEPDQQGRYGFNVKGGADCDVSLRVSKVAPPSSTSCDQLSPLPTTRLCEGDQLVLINGVDVTSFSHERVVGVIRESGAAHSQLILGIQAQSGGGRCCCGHCDAGQSSSSPVVAGAGRGDGQTGSLDEPLVQYVPDLDTVPRGVAPHQCGPLAQSILMLSEALTSGAATQGFAKLERVDADLSVTEALRPENHVKNRYCDILPYDSTRVVLATQSPHSHWDYINANHVTVHTVHPAGQDGNSQDGNSQDGNSQDVSGGEDHQIHYIACQGPLAETCSSFWTMLWQQRSRVVVMLTGLVEAGRRKCHQYWPSSLGQRDSHGSLLVELVSERTEGVSVWRCFHLTNIESGERRAVRQVQYIGWPDHGVPDNYHQFIDFVRRLDEELHSTGDPLTAGTEPATAGLSSSLAASQSDMSVVGEEDSVAFTLHEDSELAACATVVAPISITDEPNSSINDEHVCPSTGDVSPSADEAAKSSSQDDGDNKVDDVARDSCYLVPSPPAGDYHTALVAQSPPPISWPSQQADITESGEDSTCAAPQWRLSGGDWRCTNSSVEGTTSHPPQQRSGPVVIHCSAGIGRTGVFVVMHTALRLMTATQPVYPLELVRSLRRQRAMMVQTARQYQFVCEAIVSVFKSEFHQHTDASHNCSAHESTGNYAGNQLDLPSDPGTQTS